MYMLKHEKKLAVISALVEGTSIRSTERMTGVHRDTICRLLVETGGNCAALLDSHIHNVRAKYLQADEIWCFVQKKAKRVRDDDPKEFGDQWGFVAMDEDSKLVPSFVVGKRTKETTYAFLLDLQKRLIDDVRVSAHHRWVSLLRTRHRGRVRRNGRFRAVNQAVR